ncbi:60S ribosomal protein L36 [Rhynchospora pubera]|uniref:60S ribosomal protein L36 n=1 Tax=Rhynchospora pubera TaxID=906938 RepID=A0AAV8BRZ0_9POAL|nr:60S ribosomal protein L36 [Rhynchospora pubera]KAJ4812720.1 60S ribosomal protein L36 [Rhynchospora pubera]
MDAFPSSPSDSSLSSSDLDTESTGSFFPDRSTTLGTLMGVTFYNRSTSLRLNQEQRIRPRAAAAVVGRRWRWRRGGGRRWRFTLCGDMSGPTSLGEFLQVERSLYGGGVGVGENEVVRGGGGRLFENGMVLPPSMSAAPPQTTRRRLVVRRLGRLPVLFTGICCGGRNV